MFHTVDVDHRLVSLNVFRLSESLLSHDGGGLSASDPRVPVICYPRTWDSVRFYLRRKDVITFSSGQHCELTAFLRKHPHTLAFVKANSALEEFRKHLPESLEFVPQGSQAGVLAGWVRAR